MHSDHSFRWHLHIVRFGFVSCVTTRSSSVLESETNVDFSRQQADPPNRNVISRQVIACVTEIMKSLSQSNSRRCFMYRQASSAKLENLNARKYNKESDKMNSTMADETGRRRRRRETESRKRKWIESTRIDAGHRRRQRQSWWNEKRNKSGRKNKYSSIDIRETDRKRQRERERERRGRERGERERERERERESGENDDGVWKSNGIESRSKIVAEYAVFALMNVDKRSGSIFLHVIPFFGFRSRLILARCRAASITCNEREKISAHSWRDAIENLRAKDISFLFISLTIRLINQFLNFFLINRFAWHMFDTFYRFGLLTPDISFECTIII